MRSDQRNGVCEGIPQYAVTFCAREVIDFLAVRTDLGVRGWRAAPQKGLWGLWSQQAGHEPAACPGVHQAPSTLGHSVVL